MIKNIFCDLDGTLYRGGISPSDIEAINEARLNGISFNIATGRVYKHSVNILEDVASGGYLICENGSYIYDPEGSCIHKTSLTDGQIKKIIEVYRSLDYIDMVDDVIYFKYEGQIIMTRDGSSADYFTKGYEVDESFDVRLCDGVIKAKDRLGVEKEVDINSYVSMNMWGFTPEIFEILNENFNLLSPSIIFSEPIAYPKRIPANERDFENVCTTRTLSYLFTNFTALSAPKSI